MRLSRRDRVGWLRYETEYRSPCGVDFVVMERRLAEVGYSLVQELDTVMLCGLTWSTCCEIGAAVGRLVQRNRYVLG